MSDYLKEQLGECRDVIGDSDAIEDSECDVVSDMQGSNNPV